MISNYESIQEIDQARVGEGKNIYFILLFLATFSLNIFFHSDICFINRVHNFLLSLSRKKNYSMFLKSWLIKTKMGFDHVVTFLEYIDFICLLISNIIIIEFDVNATYEIGLMLKLIFLENDYFTFRKKGRNYSFKLFSSGLIFSWYIITSFCVGVNFLNLDYILDWIKIISAFFYQLYFSN